MCNKNNFFFALFLLYILLLCFLLFTGDLGFNYTRYPLEDKLIHFGAFFVGQFLVFLAGKIKGILRWLCYIVFLLLPAIAEIVQDFIPHRVRDFADMLAGYMGILACIVLWYSFKMIHKYFFLKER
ncbi:MAG: hypothetical protein ACOC34_04260 [Thermotogota bacterium]